MKRTMLFFSVPFIFFFCISFVLSLKGNECITQSRADKPIPFNHKAHMLKEYGNTLGCEQCHKYYDNGRFKGIPSVSECLQCHKKPMFKGYEDTDKPWGAFAKQPDLVYFSHTAVRKNTKTVECVSCHGDKGNSKNTSLIKGRIPMDTCMECHKKEGVSNSCATCHD